MDKTEVTHHDDLKQIYDHSDSNDSSTSYSRTTHPLSLRKERSLSNDTVPTLHHHPDVSMSRQSSSTTISDGRETSHTIIVSSEQTDDDEKHWAPAATKTKDHDNGRIRTHPMAWIALFFLVVLRSAVSIFQNTFSPIPTVVAEYLGVTLTEVNWLFNIQAVVYIALSFITGWLFERLGTKRSASSPFRFSFSLLFRLHICLLTATIAHCCRINHCSWVLGALGSCVDSSTFIPGDDVRSSYCIGWQPFNT